MLLYGLKTAEHSALLIALPKLYDLRHSVGAIWFSLLRQFQENENIWNSKERNTVCNAAAPPG